MSLNKLIYIPSAHVCTVFASILFFESSIKRLRLSLKILRGEKFANHYPKRPYINGGRWLIVGLFKKMLQYFRGLVEHSSRYFGRSVDVLMQSMLCNFS